MSVERIMAKNHLQEICNAGRALALTAGRTDDLRADVAYLLNRAGNAGRLRTHYKYDPRRDFGASSNALVTYAYTGLEPTEWPRDRSDYAACVRAVRKYAEASADAGGAGDAWKGETPVCRSCRKIGTATPAARHSRRSGGRLCEQIRAAQRRRVRRLAVSGIFPELPGKANGQPHPDDGFKAWC